MKTITILASFAGAVALSACAPSHDAAKPGAEVTPVACKADEYQQYVGRHRSAIPADAPRGRIFRVMCSSCAATMDFRDNRVNFVYDDKTEVVTRVTCG